MSNFAYLLIIFFSTTVMAKPVDKGVHFEGEQMNARFENDHGQLDVKKILVQTDDVDFKVEDEEGTAERRDNKIWLNSKSLEVALKWDFLGQPLLKKIDFNNLNLKLDNLLFDASLTSASIIMDKAGIDIYSGAVKCNTNELQGGSPHNLNPIMNSCFVNNLINIPSVKIDSEIIQKEVLQLLPKDQQLEGLEGVQISLKNIIGETVDHRLNLNFKLKWSILELPFSLKAITHYFPKERQIKIKLEEAKLSFIHIEGKVFNLIKRFNIPNVHVMEPYIIILWKE